MRFMGCQIRKCPSCEASESRRFHLRIRVRSKGGKKQREEGMRHGAWVQLSAPKRPCRNHTCEIIHSRFVSKAKGGLIENERRDIEEMLAREADVDVQGTLKRMAEVGDLGGRRRNHDDGTDPNGSGPICSPDGDGLLDPVKGARKWEAVDR